MEGERVARPSTDQETAPLLRDPETEGSNVTPTSPTFKDKLIALAEEPLTPLSKLLLVLTILFLLIASVFVGLFAGVQHKLNSRNNQPHDGGPPLTSTVITTTTEKQTWTTTAVSTATATTTATTITTTTISKPVPTRPPAETVCLSQDCIVTAASIISSLDTSQDPCENFYQYSNGGWLSANPVPGDKGSYGSFEKLAKQNGQLVRQILESDSFKPNSTSDQRLLKKIRAFYESCLDEDRLDQLGSEPLLQVTRTVRQLFRGESTDISSANKKGLNGLTAALAYLHSRGVPGLFSTVIEGDGLRPNDMSLWFYQADLGLPSKEYYEEESALAIYQDVLEQLLFTLAEGDEDLYQTAPKLKVASEEKNYWPPWPWPPWGDDDDDKKKPVNKTERAHKLAKEVVEFEKKIAKASLDLDVLQQDPIATYNPAPLGNLTEPLHHYINFGEYFAAFAIRNFPSTVIITYPPYVESLASILDSTSKDTVEAYLVTRAGLELSPYLGMNTPAWKAHRQLQEELFGLKKGVVGDRTEWCASQVEGALGFASGRFFVEETFGGDSKDKATKVITDIVAAFKRSLPHLEWMDEKSAKAAAQKADAIRVKVGYPLSPDTRDPDSLLRYYNQVTIDKYMFFDNILSARRSDQIKKWIQLGRPRNLQAWEMYPSTVNAYYNPPSSEIVFPAGILQPPFFSQKWPHYMAYGAFGQVASHELTHAFDSAGRLYDPEGRLIEWWTNSTSEAFKVKQECIVNQYSAYTIDDGKGGKIHVNGNLTSGENIGDSGIIQAFRAWKAQYSDSLAAGTEFLLPGLNYTREQMFFISFGQIWARNMKPAAAVQRVRTDPHSPTIYRVEGTLSNMPEFAKAFNCPKGSKLNPPDEKRCMFWG